MHGIVEQSGGRIFVYSEPGQGTTFKIFLPCIAAASGDVEDEDRSTVVGAIGGTEAILLVEDEPAVRSLTTSLLTRAGYSVIEAVDGAHALELCADPAVPIDLVRDRHDHAAHRRPRSRARRARRAPGHADGLHVRLLTHGDRTPRS